MSTERCLSYARKAAVNVSHIALTVGIPHKYLRNWHGLKQTQSDGLAKYSFVEITNAFVSQYGVQLQNNHRLNELLRRSCEVKSKCSKLNGRLKVE